MKKIKFAFLCAAVIFFAGTPVFAQIQLDTLQKSAEKFADSLAMSLPFNASLGLNWSDAYIENFPHFGAGASVGFTTMDAGALWGLLAQFGLISPMDFEKFPMPGYTVEGRLGGFVLPFDVGFKFGYLPTKPSNYVMDYFLAGGEIRYAIIKGNVILPSVSVGAGFTYLSGGIGTAIGSDLNFRYHSGYFDTNLAIKQPNINFRWSTSTLDFKAQISKTFFFVTPYLGVGASHGWSQTGYSVETKTNIPDTDINQAKEVFKKYGIDNLGSKGFSSTNETNAWSFRAFGGVSFNFLIFNTDLTGLYNIADSNFGASLGFRVQL